MKIQFKKLFGRFDYSIELKEDGLTIITGPNGFGKSTILDCIYQLYKKENGILFFLNLDFEEVFFLISNEKQLKITKKSGALVVNDKTNCSVNFKNIKKYFGDDFFLNRYYNQNYDKKFANRKTMDKDFAYESFIESYFNIEKNYNKKRIQKNNIMFVGNALREFSKELGKVFYIREQRLVSEEFDRFDESILKDEIKELPKKFKLLLDRNSSEYSSKSNELDSSYPIRLFNNKEAITSKDEFNQKIELMTEKFQKLNKFDLSRVQNLRNLEFKEEFAKALKIYFDDFDEKYQIYENFVNQLELFTDIINDKLDFKKIEISREEGIFIEDIDVKGKKLSLSQLSSGEKQEIILFYKLIFETPENTLLLIDEPEISLHIAWQKKFMDDLYKIIKFKNLNVIVATHSPQIINHRWENQIDLGELYEQKLD
ncbi:AAA family ATPase [Streptococcus mitis]|uniref:AAA family ATPase n=1 Tax=Streptococcus mitis TaxID=28037 RepID=UPI0021B5EC1B|nr:AAA family ATPase [Streptococcus mitis]